MKWFVAWVLTALLTCSVVGQTNVLVGTAGDYGLTVQSNVTATLTLLYPNPRTSGGIQVRQDPMTRVTGASGEYRFTNILWGKYQLSLSGRTATPFTFWVGTNTTGTNLISALITNAAAMPPNPATNYYTQAQIDALLADVSISSGALTNNESRAVVVSNSVTATGGFVGSLGASNLTGTIDGARLPSIHSTSNWFGSGFGASGLLLGTDAVLSQEGAGDQIVVSGASGIGPPFGDVGNLTGTLPVLNAVNLTNMAATNLTGTVADARLSTNVLVKGNVADSQIAVTAYADGGETGLAWVGEGGNTNVLIPYNDGAAVRFPNGILFSTEATAASPKLKNTGTSIKARLGDDSADAPFTASDGTFSGALTTTGTTNHHSGDLGVAGTIYTGTNSAQVVEADNFNIGEARVTNGLSWGGVGSGNGAGMTNLWDTHNVRFWGATNNGTADDLPAIQAAFDRLTNNATAKVGKVYFPKGTYSLSSPVVFTGAAVEVYEVVVEGEAGCAVNILTTNTTAFIFTNVPVTMSHLLIQNVGTPRTQNGIICAQAALHMSFCSIQNYGNGVYFSGDNGTLNSSLSSFDHNQFYGNATALCVTNGAINAWTFGPRNSVSHGTVGTMISGTSIHIFDNAFQTLGTAIQIGPGLSGNVVIDGANYFEAITNSCISPVVSMEGLNINGNYFNGDGSGMFLTNGIAGLSWYHLKVTDNIILVAETDATDSKVSLRGLANYSGSGYLMAPIKFLGAAGVGAHFNSDSANLTSRNWYLGTSQTYGDFGINRSTAQYGDASIGTSMIYLAATGNNIGMGGNVNPQAVLDVTGDVHANSVTLPPLVVNTNALVVATNGSVGFGTTTPQSKLDVEGGVSVGAAYSGTTASPANGLIVEGNVGIGTASPAARLHVADVNKTGALTYNAAVMTTDSIGIDVGGKLALGGRYSTTDTTLTPFGQIVGRKENASDDNGLGYLGFWTSNGSSPYSHERMRITSAGLVGIGTTAPAEKLSVVGNGSFSGTVMATNGVFVPAVANTGGSAGPSPVGGFFGFLTKYTTNTINGGVNTYANVTNYTVARTNGFGANLAGGYLTNTVAAGYYGVIVEVDGLALNNGSTVEGDLMIDDVENDEISFLKTYDPSTARLDNWGGSGIIYLTVGQRVSLKIKSGGAGGVDVYRARIRIGAP